MATRFVTTEECDAHPAFKQTYIDAGEEDIVLVKSPVGMPGRAIRNAFLERAEKGPIPHGRCFGCIKTCKPADTPYCITEAVSYTHLQIKRISKYIPLSFFTHQLP